MKRRGLTLLELLVVLAILIALATLIVPVISNLGRKSQDISTRENLLRLQELILNRYIPDMGELPRPLLTSEGKDPSGVTRKNHPQLRYLFVNPDTETISKTTGATILSSRRWQGPYLMHGGARYAIDHDTSSGAVDRKFTDAYGVGNATSGTNQGFGGDPTILDAWGRPVVLQEPDETVDGFAPTTEEKTYARLVSAGPNGIIDTPLTALMPNAVERGDDIIVFLYRHDEYSDIDDYLRLEP